MVSVRPRVDLSALTFSISSLSLGLFPRVHAILPLGFLLRLSILLLVYGSPLLSLSLSPPPPFFLSGWLSLDLAQHKLSTTTVALQLTLCKRAYRRLADGPGA